MCIRDRTKPLPKEQEDGPGENHASESPPKLNGRNLAWGPALRKDSRGGKRICHVKPPFILLRECSDESPRVKPGAKGQDGGMDIAERLAKERLSLIHI